MAEVIGEVVLLVDLAGRPRFWLLRREESADVEGHDAQSVFYPDVDGHVARRPLHLSYFVIVKHLYLYHHNQNPAVLSIAIVSFRSSCSRLAYRGK